jgi:hypothetical protein
MAAALSALEYLASTDEDDAIFCCNFPAFARRCLRHLGLSVRDLLQLHVFSEDGCINAIQVCCQRWLLDGAPEADGVAWARVYAAALQRIFPAEGKRSRAGGAGWWSLVSTATLACFVHRARRQQFKITFRNVLRTLPPACQQALWTWQLHGQPWIFSVEYLMLCVRGKIPGMGIVYAVLDEGSQTWYVGRTLSSREAGRKQWAGMAARFREHLRASFAAGHDPTEYKYKTWRRSLPHQLLMVPLGTAPVGKYEILEREIIHLARPSFQCVLSVNAKPRKPGRRPFPRFRKTPGWPAEVCSNHLVALHRNGLRDGLQRLWWTGRELCAYMGISEGAAQQRMYTASVYSMDLLATWAAQLCSRLGWRAIWSS